jgi:ABC-type nitrate/sulfonate/bicarbonate transport system substrate-binding protein
MIQKCNSGLLLRSLIFGVTILTLALPCLALAQEGKARIRISYPSISIANLALFAAQQWNIFEQNGLEAANAASASGDIHYVAGVGPNSVAATLRGLPSRAVWFASERLVYSIVARPEFKSLKDLRGKRIAVTGLGGTSEVVLRLGLEAAGENPKDFIIIGLGAAQLMSGLESGSIEAANFNPPFLYFAKRKGFRELLDVGAHAQMPLGGLTASNTSIQNRAAELKRIIRSMQIARRMLLQAKEKSVDFIVRAIKVDRQTAEDSYEDYRKTSSGSGVPSREGMEQIVKSLQLLGQFTGKKVAFEEIADARIAREVARELGYKVD